MKPFLVVSDDFLLVRGFPAFSAKDAAAQAAQAYKKEFSDALKMGFKVFEFTYQAEVIY